MQGRIILYRRGGEGLRLEVIHREGKGEVCATPVLFVHGAWHGAWCWDEGFMGYFAERGFDCYALSFRNHGESEHRGQLRWKRGADYVEDLRQVVGEIGRPPILVGHSMGGYVVQKYLEQERVPATVLLASVPSNGALGGTLRTMRKHPLALVKTNLQLRLWPVVETPALARDALFSESMPESQVRGYFGRLQDESYLTFLDMVFLNLPHPKKAHKPPMLVLGGANDGLFTPSEARRTAHAYGAEVGVFPGMAHDMMLEAGWETVAEKVVRWLKGVPGIW